jgi:hypothetical protein
MKTRVGGKTVTLQTRPTPSSVYTRISDLRDCTVHHSLTYCLLFSKESPRRRHTIEYENTILATDIWRLATVTTKELNS